MGSPFNANDPFDEATFNATDDASFQKLVSGGTLGSGNVLRDLLPSSFNLTSSCLATLDIFNRNATFYIPTVRKPTPNDMLDIGAAVLQLAPANFTDAGPEQADVFDAVAYWQAIAQLPATPEVLDNAVQLCNTTGHLGLATKSLDFQSNCSATSNFWWRFLTPKNAAAPNATDMLALVRPALPEASSSYSDATILIALGFNNGTSYNGTLNNLGTVPNNATLLDTVSSATDACTATSCLDLAYQGDADIGGLGAVVSYASIAFFTTVVCAVCGWYYYHDDGLPEMTTPARRAAIKASLVFADTVTFFAIMTALASDIYIYSASTIYEFGLATLVGCMAFCASCLLAIVDLFPMDADEARVRTFSRFVAITMAQNVAIPALSHLNGLPNFVSQFIDMPCYGSNLWPAPFIQAGAWMTIATWIPFTLVSFALGTRQWLEKRNRRIPPLIARYSPFNRICFYIGITGSALTLWYCIFAIIYIRERSRRAFGRSFEDDSFGYGQIIASGFVLQVIVSYIIIRLHPYLGKWREQHQITNLAEFKRRDTKLSKLTDVSQSQSDGATLNSPNSNESWAKAQLSHTVESSEPEK